MIDFYPEMQFNWTAPSPQSPTSPISLRLKYLELRSVYGTYLQRRGHGRCGLLPSPTAAAAGGQQRRHELVDATVDFCAAAVTAQVSGDSDDSIVLIGGGSGSGHFAARRLEAADVLGHGRDEVVALAAARLFRERGGQLDPIRSGGGRGGGG